MLRIFIRDVSNVCKNVNKVRTGWNSPSTVNETFAIFTRNLFFPVDKFTECKKLCNTRGDVRSESSEYFFLQCVLPKQRKCVVHHRCIALPASVQRHTERHLRKCVKFAIFHSCSRVVFVYKQNVNFLLLRH